MLKNRLLLGLTIIVSIFAACEKPEVYNADAQLEIDEAIIKNWMDTSGVELTRDKSGLYYRIITPGSGSAEIDSADILTVEYTAKLMNDSIFSSASPTNPYKFTRGSVMESWRIGLSLIKQGGQIEMMVPSLLGYRNYPVQGVPANSVLHFNIDLKKVEKKADKKI